MNSLHEHYAFAIRDQYKLIFTIGALGTCHVFCHLCSHGRFSIHDCDVDHLFRPPSMTAIALPGALWSTCGMRLEHTMCLVIYGLVHIVQYLILAFVIYFGRLP